MGMTPYIREKSQTQVVVSMIRSTFRKAARINYRAEWQLLNSRQDGRISSQLLEMNLFVRYGRMVVQSIVCGPL